MEKILFIKEFMKNWNEVGSITPSSWFLIQKMLRTIDFDTARIIVEIGAGSGCITRELLKNMKTDSQLIIFETNTEFYRELKKIHDSRITVHNEPAVNIRKQLGGKQVDHIVSGIPLATLSPEDKENLLVICYKTLMPQGQYIQFQYSLESRGNLKNIFDEVKIGFTPLNIPPAFVYTCIKNKRAGESPVT